MGGNPDSPQDLAVEVGATVQVHSLIRSPEYNGLHGVVLEHVNARGRWGIKTVTGHSLSLKPANFVVIYPNPLAKAQGHADATADRERNNSIAAAARSAAETERLCRCTRTLPCVNTLFSFPGPAWLLSYLFARLVPCTLAVSRRLWYGNTIFVFLQNLSRRRRCSFQPLSLQRKSKMGAQILSAGLASQVPPGRQLLQVMPLFLANASFPSLNARVVMADRDGCTQV